MDDSQISNLLLIGAYRDNEVHLNHPLKLTLDKIKNENILVNTIFLKSLERITVQHLIAETFHFDLKETNLLATNTVTVFVAN